MRQTEFFLKACDPKTLTVGQLMQDAVTRCTSRTDVLTIAHMMTHRNFGSLPVVEEDGTLVGVVTEYDLLQAMIEGRDLRKILATEIMSATRRAVIGSRGADFLSWRAYGYHGITAVTRLAEPSMAASAMIISSIRLRLTGLTQLWTRKTSAPRTDSSNRA